MYGSILAGLREYAKSKVKFINDLLKCALCTGFWSGVVVGSIVYYFKDSSLDILFLPLISSAVCWLYDSVIGVLHSTEERNKSLTWKKY
jgi:hypothetical protein